MYYYILLTEYTLLYMWRVIVWILLNNNGYSSGVTLGYIQKNTGWAADQTDTWGHPDQGKDTQGQRNILPNSGGCLLWDSKLKGQIKIKGTTLCLF